MIQDALVYGMSSFSLCFLVHLFFWRFRRPESYPMWLSVIFLVVPLIFLSGSVVYFILFHNVVVSPLTISGACLVHSMISVCYIFAYAGIVEYTPSVEIMHEVKRAMPIGIREGDLKMESLSEEMLTGKRIRHLVSAGMVTRNDVILQVTPKGKLVVETFKIYRRVMNLPPYGKG